MRLPTDRARRLILLYGAILAGHHALFALPGGPYYPGHSQALWIAVDALILWRLYRGSSIAWAISVALNALALVALGLVLDDLTGLVLCVQVAALLAILLSRPVRHHVYRRRARYARA